MEAFLATLWAEIGSWAASSTSKLIASITGQVGHWTDETRQTLIDAQTKFAADVASGKGLEASAADALTLFYNEEGKVVHQASMFTFKAFLADFGVPQGN